MLPYIAQCWNIFIMYYISITVILLLLCFNYSILNFRVKTLRHISQSASNLIFLILISIKNNKLLGFSESLRNGIIYYSTLVQEERKLIRKHVPTHLKPVNDDFGHYLAGIIEGDGCFAQKSQLSISFNSLDISTAHYLKSELDCGSVRPIKGKNAVVFSLGSKASILLVLDLINGKLKTQKKIEQIKDNILPNLPYKYPFITELNPHFNNSWLAGFSDADASFQIKILNRQNRKEVRLVYQVDQKAKDILILIQGLFGGYIGHRESQNTFYYGRTSFGNALKVVNYFDKYHLQSTKYDNYLKWRKAYTIVQEGNHLTEAGLNEIIKLKRRMNFTGLKNKNINNLR